MNNIPKIIHFYWGSTVLPYLRYMSLYSFKKFNPDWEVRLYIPTKLVISKSWNDPWNKTELHAEDYMDRVTDIATVLSFDMESIGYNNEISEVIKSDIVRLYLLSEIGGVWSDLDIIFFKPISFGIPNLDFTAMFCNHGFHSIGFLAGALGNIAFQELFSKVKSFCNYSQYEGAGSLFYNKQVVMNSLVYNLPMEVVYPQDYNFAESMVTSPASEKLSYIKENTIGWHWYAGNPVCGEFQNVCTETTYKNYNNIITYLIGKVIE